MGKVHSRHPRRLVSARKGVSAWLPAKLISFASGPRLPSPEGRDNGSPGRLFNIQARFGGLDGQ